MGLRPAVVQSETGPLGPRLARRAELLEERGILVPGQRTEEIVVVRGVRAAA